MTNISHLSDETRDELASLALRLSNDQKTRKGFLGLVKEAAPQTPIPEIDTAKDIDSRFATERAEREKFEKEQRERWFAEDLARKKNAVSDRYSLSADDMKKMEERMGKKELPADYEWAARLYKQETEVATPTNYGSSGYGPFDIEHNAKELNGLMEDTDNWASRTAHQMIDDIQKKGRSPAF